MFYTGDSSGKKAMDTKNVQTNKLWTSPNERNELVVIQTPYTMTSSWLHSIC